MNYYLKYAISFHRLLPKPNLKLMRERKRLFRSYKRFNFLDIPIFIISYNRLSYLQQLVNQLEKRNYRNIKIIDNASTYPPLIEYYKSIPYEVISLQDNDGHMSFWKNAVFDEYRDKLYVVTDPDVSILDETPNDFIEVFYRYLKKYPRLRKVGFSLRIDDIPDDAPLFEKVKKWESVYSRFKVPGKNAYIADIDTTFALYIPDYLAVSRRFFVALRTGYPYQVRHLPWYKKEDDITQEDIYYSNHRTNGFWDETAGTMTTEGKEAEKNRLDE